MGHRWGSWLPLLVAAVLFLLLFSWQRSRSTVVQIGRERAVAATLRDAVRHQSPDVSVADVLALRDLVGTADLEVWGAATTEFALGLSRAQRNGANLDEAAAAAIRALTPDAVAVRRFLLLRERFATGS